MILPKSQKYWLLNITWISYYHLILNPFTHQLSQGLTSPDVKGICLDSKCFEVILHAATFSLFQYWQEKMCSTSNHFESLRITSNHLASTDNLPTPGADISWCKRDSLGLEVLRSDSSLLEFSLYLRLPSSAPIMSLSLESRVYSTDYIGRLD